jgi:hypothetical protein
MRVAALLTSFVFASFVHGAVTVSAPLTLRDGILTSRGAMSESVWLAQSAGTFVLAWTEIGDDHADHLYIAPLASLYSALDLTRKVDVGPIANASVPFITSGGPYFAVSYTASDVTRRVRLYDRDLAPVTASLMVARDVDTSQMVWSGRDFILPGTLRLNFLNSSGFRSAPSVLDTSQVQQMTVKAAAALPDGSNALMLTWPVFSCFDICGVGPQPMTAIALDDAHQTQTTTALSDFAYPAATLGSSSNGFLALWPEGRTFTQMATIFDANGAIQATIRLQSFMNLEQVFARQLIAGDGDEWLVIALGKLYQIEGSTVTSQTVSPKGSQLLRTGPGSYVLIYSETDDGIRARIQLVRITTQPQRTRGSRH